MTRAVDEQLALLGEQCVDVITRDELRSRLAQGRPLRVKLGIDPSGPLLHLGHAVVLRKLRQFQDLGHQAVLIVGDFTAQIGDPTGLSSARPPRSADQIRADMRTYEQQAAAVLDMQRTTVRYNSEWLDGLRFADAIRLASKLTVARMLERDDFTKRFQGNAPIGLHEFLYPLTVAYDSVVIEADVELGGNEQLFNLMLGRRLQEEFKQPPQICMTLPVLEGTDGVQRMGKSLNNYVALTEEPQQMFGKVMSIPDALIPRYWRLATTTPPAECESLEKALGSGELAARDVKLRLAREIVRLYHGDTTAQEAQEHFERTVVRKELPAQIDAFALASDGQSPTIARLLVLLGWAASNREAYRLVQQGAIRVDGERVDDPLHTESSWDGKVVQKGNHQFARIARR